MENIYIYTYEHALSIFCAVIKIYLYSNKIIPFLAPEWGNNWFVTFNTSKNKLVSFHHHSSVKMNICKLNEAVYNVRLKDAKNIVSSIIPGSNWLLLPFFIFSEQESFFTINLPNIKKTVYLWLTLLINNYYKLYTLVNNVF